MKREQIVVIDTETGGLDPYHHSLLSIGLVSWCGRYQTELFVIEDELNTNPRSMEINKIDLNWLKTVGKSPADVCDQIDHFIQELPVHPVIFAGHNIAFDLAFLKRLYHLASRALPSTISHRSLDTHTLLWLLSDRQGGDAHLCTSDGAFQHFGVSPPEQLRHTALGDAMATRDLLVQLLDQLNAPLNASLSDKTQVYL